MSDAPCHQDRPTSPKELASSLLLKTFGARRVADWCRVGEATVYQWLSRGTDDNPIPVKHVASVVAGAVAAKLTREPDAVWRTLWPSMPAPEPTHQDAAA